MTRHMSGSAFASGPIQRPKEFGIYIPASERTTMKGRLPARLQQRVLLSEKVEQAVNAARAAGTSSGLFEAALKGLDWKGLEGVKACMVREAIQAAINNA